MWDEYWQEHFTLRAIIFVTINDYPALFALLGQIKGKMACVVCVDKTSSVYLMGSMKIVYMRHHRFLISTHKSRKMKEKLMAPMRKMRLLNRLQDKQCVKCARKSCSSLERSQHQVPKRKRKRKRGISRMKLQKSSTTCHSRRCLSSLSICHTGRSRPYAMPLIVCIYRRTCLTAPPIFWGYQGR